MAVKETPQGYKFAGIIYSDGRLLLLFAAVPAAVSLVTM